MWGIVAEAVETAAADPELLETALSLLHRTPYANNANNDKNDKQTGVSNAGEDKDVCSFEGRVLARRQGVRLALYPGLHAPSGTTPRAHVRQRVLSLLDASLAARVDQAMRASEIAALNNVVDDLVACFEDVQVNARVRVFVGVRVLCIGVFTISTVNCRY